MQFESFHWLTPSWLRAIIPCSYFSSVCYIFGGVFNKTIIPLALGDMR